MHCLMDFILMLDIYRNMVMEFFPSVDKITMRLYFFWMIIHHSLVDASSIIRKQRFLHDSPFWPLPEPLLAVSTTNVFECTYACTMRVDCSFYSYNKPTRKCYLYADQPGAPVVNAKPVCHSGKSISMIRTHPVYDNESDQKTSSVNFLFDIWQTWVKMQSQFVIQTNPSVSPQRIVFTIMGVTNKCFQLIFRWSFELADQLRQYEPNRNQMKLHA